MFFLIAGILEGLEHLGAPSEHTECPRGTARPSVRSECRSVTTGGSQSGGKYSGVWPQPFLSINPKMGLLITADRGRTAKTGIKNGLVGKPFSLATGNRLYLARG